MTQTSPPPEIVDALDDVAIEQDPQKDPPLVVSLLRTARPKQWVKNVLIFSAPAAAGRLSEIDVLGKAAFAAVMFTLASIATYYVNDALDHQADRRHPTKRYRPIAAGYVSLPIAWTVAVASIVIGIGAGAAVLGTAFALLIAGYFTMTLSYSLKLKHVAVIELVCVAAGFVLRMIAGGIATGIVLTDWFLTVACFSSLFVVAGKRYAEVLQMGEGSSGSRRVLSEYTAGFLRSTWVMAMAVAVSAYCLWAFQRADASGNHVWYQLSAVPWTTGLLRYALLLEKGHGGAPEDVLLSDRILLILGVIWLVLFGLGVYG